MFRVQGLVFVVSRAWGYWGLGFKGLSLRATAFGRIGALSLGLWVLGSVWVCRFGGSLGA